MRFISFIKYLLVTVSASLVFVRPVSAATLKTATRSSELKIKACQAREQIIRVRMNNLLKITGNMEVLFDDIAFRVEQFYQNKIFGTGKTISDYESLVQAIQTKKDMLKASLDIAKSDSLKFTCSSNNPKLALTAFRDDMFNVKSTLADLRTSIKNLIVAVQAVVILTPSPKGVGK